MSNIIEVHRRKYGVYLGNHSPNIIIGLWSLNSVKWDFEPFKSLDLLLKDISVVSIYKSEFTMIQIHVSFSQKI